MENNIRLQKALDFAVNFATNLKLEFLTPEAILLGIIVMNDEFKELARGYFTDIENDFKNPLIKELDAMKETPYDLGEPTDDDDFVDEYTLELSAQAAQLIATSAELAASAGKKEVDVPHVLRAMLQLEESLACYLLQYNFTEDEGKLMYNIIKAYDQTPMTFDDEDTDEDDPYGSADNDSKERAKREEWKAFVTCLNDNLDNRNPLIGREKELDRTIQVLCRRDKNNPLHVGEPGVGKTALVYGLAQRIADGNVPERLKGARIYQLDMADLIAGTQYRGEFEERMKRIMRGVSEEPGSIIYIDEIHTLVGAGATGEGAMDGSNMLKPYLESGTIRFIGSTTYKEFNRYFQKSQGMVRRFQQIDIEEPSAYETTAILNGLKGRYEAFHGVKYDDGTMALAVELSQRYISNRFLPDKAIDIIDEAGAYREMHPLKRKVKGEEKPLKVQRIDKKLISDTVTRLCKLNEQTLEATTEGAEQLQTLEARINSQIFGQQEAIRLTTEAVMMGKAGLLDADKPIASMLFVGPTGVGKTEVCRVLAKELGIELIRFDMSEYTEKHTVAKLIGSPAGYVGYEDGGLLTDAIRKTPNCVLLLDEIEKAHTDIYNILLQVMDYARLTDNKGQHADFRHVILIMTSNAGAQHAAQATVGFASQETTGGAMMKAVKRTFKPEFLGRLSSTVVFRDLDTTMAEQILDKQLRKLASRTAQRGIELCVSNEARKLLLDKGFSPRKGARNLDHTINTILTPLLTRAILFGSLKNGGKAFVEVLDGEIEVKVKSEKRSD